MTQRDDGFTGTNFERPGFTRMLADIYDKKVNMVIVKDLSRFGRDYVESGRYIKKIFPSLKVRFVSVMESFDSLTATSSDYNLILPIRNFINDQYSGDTSYKVRSNQSAMRSEGQYIGPYVSYGKRKSADDKHVIMADEYASRIILDMVNDLLSGYTVQKISERLNARGVLAPSDYKRQQGIKYHTSFQAGLKSRWTPQAVIRALSDPMNVGTMVQGKWQRINYKVRKVVPKPKEEYDIKENAVPAIMTKDTYELVRRLLLADMRVSPGQDKVYIFCGLLYCGDCKKGMTRRKVRNQVYYICTSYNKGEGCTRHSIPETLLHSVVLTAIQTHIMLWAEAERVMEDVEFLGITAKDVKRYDDEIQDKYRELKRNSRLQALLDKDQADQIITEEEFLEFKEVYEKRCCEIEGNIRHLKEEIQKLTQRGEEKIKWIQEFKQFKNIKELNRILLVLLIDKIFIFDDKRVEILFRFHNEYEGISRYCKEALSVEVL